MFERVVHPARGRDGGHDGARGRVAVKDGQDFRGKGKESIPSGATLVMETPGGAGIGSPLDRDPVLINADLREGVISSSAAVSIYRRKSD